MDQIMEMLGKIDFEAIIAGVQKVVAWVQESGIIENIVAAVKELIASVTA